MKKTINLTGEAMWWAEHLDAAAWWQTESVTPLQAALLLSGYNPNHPTATESANRDTQTDFGPDDFRRLCSVFEGANPSPKRSLSDWELYARARELQIHPWVKNCKEEIDKKFTDRSKAGAADGSQQVHKGRRRWGKSELLELYELSILPGMTHQKLADIYGVRRQYISTLLNKARELHARPRDSHADPFNISRRKNKLPS